MYDDIVRNVETAIANGRTDIVLALIENYKKAKDVNKEEVPLKTFLNSYLTDGGSFLQLATKLNQTDIARALLLSGSDPGFQDVNGHSAVDLAAGSAQMTALYQQELLRVTALSDIGRIGQLLDAGVDVNCQDSASSGNRPLHWAVTFSDLLTVTCLLERGADVNAINCIGATPLFDAVVRGDVEIVQELLRHGADLTVRAVGKFSNQTLFDLAAPNPEMLTALRDPLYTSNLEIDFEQCSDSTTSSWVNAYGSRESLIMVENETMLSSSLLDSPQLRSSNIFIDDTMSIVQQSPVAEVHDVCKQPRKSNDTEGQKRLRLLWPFPHRMEVLGGETSLPKNLEIYFVENQNPSLVVRAIKLWRVHEARLAKVGYTCSFKGIHAPAACASFKGVICQINPSLFSNKPEAFTLSIMMSQVRIAAADASGLFYAIGFLVQFLTVHSDMQEVPAVQVMDWPTWSCRGVTVEVSVSRPTPTLQSIRGLIDLMAHFRLNHLFLVLCYAADASAKSVFTPSEIFALNEYCEERCVALLPGFELDNLEGFLPEHFARLISHCLSHFSSQRCLFFGRNATLKFCKLSIEGGCFPDLPIPLGSCFYLDSSSASASAASASTLASAFGAFLAQLPLNAIPLLQYKTLWDRHETSNFQQTLVAKSSPFSIMTNVALTNSVAGCSEALLSPFQRLARGLSSSGTALVLSNSLLAKSISLSTFQVPGLVFAAGITWNPNIKLPEVAKVLPDLLDTHTFEKKGFGNAVIRLSSVDNMLAGRLPTNGSSFAYQLIVQPDSVSLEGLTPEKLQKSVRDIKLCIAALPTVRREDCVEQQILEEIHFVADLLLFSCRLCRNLLTSGKNPNPRRAAGLSVINVGLSNLPPTSRTDLANRLLELTHRFQKLWLQRNLPGGLQGSVQVFNHLFHQLIPRTGMDNVISI